MRAEFLSRRTKIRERTQHYWYYLCIGGYGAAIGLLTVSFLRCQIVMPIVCLTFAVAVTGAGFSGNAPYLVELAPNYAGEKCYITILYID
jgi:hypothetical protein